MVAAGLRARVPALILAIGLLGLAGCGGSPNRQAASAAYSPPFAVLQSPATRVDALRPLAAQYLLKARKPAFSITDIRDAREVLSKQEGWLIPAAEGKLCLVRVVYPLVPRSNGKRLPPSISQTCASEADAVDGRLLETQSLSTTFAKRLPTRVDGIVPDGVHHVLVGSTIDGASKAVPVVRNAYEVIVVNPRSVTFVAEQAGRRRRYIVRTPSVAGGKP
jgi:hypothetical protein